MVNIDVRVTNVSHPEEGGVHLRKVLGSNDFQGKLLVLFLDTCGHPRFVLGRVFVSAHFQLDGIIARPLNCDRECEGSGYLGFILCLRICEGDGLVVDDM